MESAALRCSLLLRNVLPSLEQPLSPDRAAAIAQLLVGSGLLSPGPDGIQGGLWAPVTELQGKLIEQLLKLLSKAEASFRPGAAVLLGVACRHVATRSFLASYAEWASALLDALRRDTAAASRAAGLHALSELFTRVQELLDVPGVRREASGPAGRTLQLATPLLADAGCRAAALAAIRAVLTALPAVARNHAAALEAQLAALLAAPATPLPLRCASARAVALLPRAVAADADAWSGLCRRTLLSAHAAVDQLLHHGGAGGDAGSSDGGLGTRAREQLEAAAPAAGAAPGGAEAEGLLAAAGFPGPAASGAGARPGVAHALQVLAALLDLLEALLAGGANGPVPVPGHAVLLLVMRLVKVDAPALLAPGRVAPSSSAQAELLAALPALHRSAWRLLRALLRCGRSGLMPLMSLVCRLLSDALRRIKAGGAGGLACSLPAGVRTCLYQATTAALRSGGFAAGRALAAEALGAIITELYGLSAVQQQQQQQAALYGSGAGGMGKGGRPLGSAVGLASPPPAKKAKTGGDPLTALDLSTAAAAAAAVAPVASPEDAAAQAAALAVAEALLQVAGPALPADVRGHLDALAYHMAAVCADGALRAVRETGAAAAARAAELAALRVAATRALIASLAAPWPSRPPFLAEGLALLRSGAAGGGGPELAAASCEGLLALEALLRPRAAPPAAAGLFASGADAAPGLQLPRPRLWSMLDPVQPQLPAPAPAPAPVPAPAAAPVASSAPAQQQQTPGQQPQQQKRKDGGAVAELEGPGRAGGPTVMALPATVAGANGAAKGAAADKQAVKASPAPATGGKSVAAREGAKAISGGAGGKGGKRKEAPATGDVDMAEQGQATPAATAVVPAPAVSAAPFVAAAPPQAATAAAPVAASAAAVFGDESEDSEGSLPEIDSGNESGSDDEE
ncbi:hypothetical protein GPECTOR_3g46 [Gonium pectorale]|uniref:Pre-rRNA-processing protein RIX1 N-terminal domain-containing protein n=1 Tax=Gonium pectorale TaxID=33097 RepID=A0A150GZI1_GONPE|nr:hypothetical protein GPECTOR_3g46 [Gonium pectorale]|eukprot:KXZ55327.1 hypothetical protein GPECTOR_3g46 [Gonium pectorale]